MAVVKRIRQHIIQDVLCEASTSKSNVSIQQEIPPKVSHIKENMDIEVNTP